MGSRELAKRVEVVLDRPLQHERVLWYDCHALAQSYEAHTRNVHAVQQHLAGRGLIESEEEHEETGLACP